MTRPSAIERAVNLNQLSMDETIDLLKQHDVPSLALAHAYILHTYRDYRMEHPATLTSERYNRAIDLADRFYQRCEDLKNDVRPTFSTNVLVDLIDHAYLTEHLDPDLYYPYLKYAGMTAESAQDHAETITAIGAKDAERAAYHADPDKAPRYCTRCGTRTPKHELSQRCLCVKCGHSASWQAIENLMNRHGPYYRRWREGMLKAIYALEDEIAHERKQEQAIEDTTHEDLVKSTPAARAIAAMESIGSHIDHDKAPPCLGFCIDCPEAFCNSRTDPYGTYPDSWTCPNCKANVRRERNYCPRCHKPKPS